MIFGKLVSSLFKKKERDIYRVKTIGDAVLNAELVYPYGFKSVPVENTKALIERINPNFSLIVACEDIKDLELKAGECCLYSTDDSGNVVSKIKILKDNSIELIADKIKLNGDNLGGIIEVEKLRNELAKNNMILQTILDVCKVPVNEAGNGSPSVFQQTLNGALMGKTVGDFSQIENKNITHGK